MSLSSPLAAHRPAVAFTIDGAAAPQGSKTPWGSEANPRTRPWRAAVAAAAAAAMGGDPPLHGPVSVQIQFAFPRPKGHYGSGRNATTLRPTAPGYHAYRPDLDKLIRAIGDALTGIVLRDDAQIAALFVTKVYAAWARTDVAISPLPATAADDARRAQ